MQRLPVSPRKDNAKIPNLYSTCHENLLQKEAPEAPLPHHLFTEDQAVLMGRGLFESPRCPGSPT